jgi:prepilin-type N-terminal cleavage/methylation domain-containing protein
MSDRARSREDGFTLIEVLVSLTILGVGLAVLLQIFAGGLDVSRETQAEMNAAGLARSLLDELGTLRPLQEGDVSGQFDEQYSWQVRAQHYGSYDERQSWSANPLLVTVVVRWQDGAQPRSLSLTTLRFAGPESKQ